MLYLLFFSNYRHSVKGIVDYNMIPFKTILNYIFHFKGFSSHSFMDNFFGNIFAFLPLGLLLPIMVSWFNSYKKIIAISCITSIVIELSQFTFRLGALDVDDVILNIIGGICGYSIVVFVSKGIRKIENR
ncbi:MAG TPA: VanZ family protein [Bacilli bacterium]|nr:VanZ family protein [Bacilli bacterium]